MIPFATPDQWIFGSLLLLSSLGIILCNKPVQASLCFLLTLVSLAALYFELSAQFIGAMQILIYAGAILVIFMFVIVLFQDAHQQIDRYKGDLNTGLLTVAAGSFLAALLFLAIQLVALPTSTKELPAEFGTVQSMGRLLYVDFFFPFEAVILIFLVAVIGALYIARKER